MSAGQLLQIDCGSFPNTGLDIIVLVHDLIVKTSIMQFSYFKRILFYTLLPSQFFPKIIIKFGNMSDCKANSISLHYFNHIPSLGSESTHCIIEATLKVRTVVKNWPRRPETEF